MAGNGGGLRAHDVGTVRGTFHNRPIEDASPAARRFQRHLRHRRQKQGRGVRLPRGAALIGSPGTLASGAAGKGSEEAIGRFGSTVPTGY